MRLLDFSRYLYVKDNTKKLNKSLQSKITFQQNLATGLNRLKLLDSNLTIIDPE